MLLLGSDVTKGKTGMPNISTGLIGRMRLPTYKGNPTELQEWLMNIQKKQVIYRLSDNELVLLAFERPKKAVEENHFD